MLSWIVIVKGKVTTCVFFETVLHAEPYLGYHRLLRLGHCGFIIRNIDLNFVVNSYFGCEIFLLTLR